MRDDQPILPFLLDALRLNPAVDAGASLAELVRGRGDATTALAFLPFFGWGKKAKRGAKLMKRAPTTHTPGALSASQLKAAERAWAQGLGGLARTAPPPQTVLRSAVEPAIPFFERFAPSRQSAKLAEDLWANFERFGK